jgi:AcrR family transcriptional regulator
MARGTSAETRERIGTAAASLFAAHGYARTSVRDIATSAGADPALVIRHFGSKELLFLEVMHPSLEDDPLIVVPLEQLGRRFIELMIEDSHGSRKVYLALVRGSSEPSISKRLRTVHERAFVEPLLSRLSGEDAELRARLAASLVGGLLYSMWVVGDERLLAADHDQIVERYGALLQAILTPAD